MKNASRGLPKFFFNEGFFPQLGFMVSGAKEFPLDKATAIYCCLLSCATWDFDEELVFIDMAELELRFCKEDAEEMANMLVQESWAAWEDDWLILARIENGRIQFPFQKKKPTRTAVAAAPTRKAVKQPQTTKPAATPTLTWVTDPDFAELNDWLTPRYDAWHGYLDGRKKASLAESTLSKISSAAAAGYEKRLTNAKFMDYFYGLCAVYFEWTDSPARPPAKDFQTATRLVKSTDHRTLLLLVPFWLDNCEKIKKGMSGDSLSSFGYFFNQMLTLKAKSNVATTSKRNKYAPVTEL